MDVGVCIFLVFVAVYVSPVVGDFKTSSLALAPVFDIGDGSFTIRAYPCKFSWIWRYQLLTINSNVIEGNKELGWAQVKCADFEKIKRELSPGYVSLGDAIFVSAVKGQPVIVIFRMKNRKCQKKVLTDENWNLLDKVVNKPLTKPECITEIKKIKPRKVHLGSKTMIVRLDPKTVTKVIQSNIKRFPQQLTGEKPQQLTIKKTSAGEIVATGAAGAAVVATKEQAKQPVRRQGSPHMQPPMSMLSLYSSDIDQYISKWEEGVAWYLSDQLVMTLQNMYRGLTCIRVVVIAKAVPDENEEDIEIAKFKTTCGKVEGLTVYPDLIKYQKGFVFVLENENEASGYFNLRSDNCLLRKYTIDGRDVKWTDVNQNDNKCKEFISDTTGTILGKEYKDNSYGLLADGVNFEYVSNNSSPKEEEEKQAKEEKEAEGSGDQAGSTSSWGFLSRWFGKA